jgi:16S rRNA (guanine1207-N2)-methyltransferase
MTHGVYGAPPRELAEVPPGAVQLSPLVPGAQATEALADGALEAVTVLAPPGVLERRYVLAQALRVLAPGGQLTALAPNDRGGGRLGRELADFGCAVAEAPKRRHRICRCARPAAPTGLEAAITEGALRFSDPLGAWTWPGVFSWDRVDEGSALLAGHLPALAGAGADLGCGIGFLARAALKEPAVRSLALVDIDRRAIEAARRNIEDPRARFLWADARSAGLAPASLDFVIMNPPFHGGGREDRALGQAFIETAARLLKPRGVCALVANRHLPYEATMAACFPQVALRIEAHGFKVYEARK